MAEDGLEPLAYEAIIVTVEQAPLFGKARLAQVALEACRECAAGVLRACAVSPFQVHALLAGCDLYAVNRWVEQYKARSEPRLLEAIARYYAEELLDTVARYSPVWPETVYRVWQEGFHCQAYWEEASVTKRINALRDRGILWLNR